MLSKNISNSGIRFVERALAYPPEHRVTAREALGLGWLRLEDEEVAELETEGDGIDPALPEGQLLRGVRPPPRIPALAPQQPPVWKRLEIEEGQTSPALPQRPAPSGGEVANGGSQPGNGKVGFRNRVAVAMEVKGQRAAGGWCGPAVARNWNRGRELGRGAFGTVFLERSEKGECRAVKVIANDKDSRIDYRRELMAMAILAKVRDMDALHSGLLLNLAEHLTA